VVRWISCLDVIRGGMSEDHDKCFSTLVLGACLVLVCRGRYGFWGGILLFILGSTLGGVGPNRDLRGGGRRGWCDELARSSYDHPTFSYH